MAWKTLKDYLESQGVEVLFPRDVIKQAFHYQLIEDGELWMQMLEKRNVMVLNYNKERFEMVIKLIKEKYYAAIEQVYLTLGAKNETWVIANYFKSHD